MVLCFVPAFFVVVGDNGQRPYSSQFRLLFLFKWKWPASHHEDVRKKGYEFANSTLMEFFHRKTYRLNQPIKTNEITAIFCHFY